MPYPMWRHECRPLMTISTTSPICSHCRQGSVFDGWRLSMHEAMARYQYVYGLKPLGAHRPMADQLLALLREDCPRCQGESILTIDRGAWRICPVCEGAGGTWTAPAEVRNSAYAWILERFPEAEASEAPSRFIGGPLIHDLGTNRMLGCRKG